ncbi:MAG: RidA family protein [Deltaproteobacteria bacterium]|nr:RidA family protein [Deltaproteobacteria bacterium]
METLVINPDQLVKPRGYNHGIKTSGTSALLFLGGQVAWDREGKLVGEKNIGVQFDKALENILSVVREAGGQAENIVKLNIYVTDKNAYVSAGRETAQAYRKHMGKHFPTMTLVEVKSLYEPRCMVEIEGMAVL